MKLVRWSNVLFLIVLVWVMEKWVATPILNQALFGEQLPWFILALIIAATALIAAGGYVVNDYFDVKIDRINRPDEVIVTRSVSKPAAMRLSWILSGTGIVCGIAVAVLLRSLTLGILFVMVPGLLWFYSSSYKRLFMAILNLRYAVVMPYTTLGNDLYIWLGGFAVFAFLLTWIREIIKDMQDQMGDRELECHSMPVVWGETWTKVFVTVLIVGTIALIGHVWYHLLPFDISWRSLSTRYIVLGILIPLLSAIWLLWAAKIPSDYKTCQQVIKFTMLIGMLYSFVIMRMLA